MLLMNFWEDVKKAMEAKDYSLALNTMKRLCYNRSGL